MVCPFITRKMYTATYSRSASDTVGEVKQKIPTAHFYHRLLKSGRSNKLEVDAASWLNKQIFALDLPACDLPDDPQDLHAWMQCGVQQTTQKYAEYLHQRKHGAKRTFFSNWAHALHFLKSVAPNKLVKSAWLYGLLEHWRNPRFLGLIKTYIEELGNFIADKNHVVTYQTLLARYGLDLPGDVDDNFYAQGLI